VVVIGGYERHSRETTDPDNGLYRKAAGWEAKLSYMGRAVMENRHWLAVTAWSGTPWHR
jgi:hypothetical protein